MLHRLNLFFSTQFTKELIFTRSSLGNPSLSRFTNEWNFARSFARSLGGVTHYIVLGKI